MRTLRSGERRGIVCASVEKENTCYGEAKLFSFSPFYRLLAVKRFNDGVKLKCRAAGKQ